MKVVRRNTIQRVDQRRLFNRNKCSPSSIRLFSSCHNTSQLVQIPILPYKGLLTDQRHRSSTNLIYFTIQKSLSEAFHRSGRAYPRLLLDFFLLATELKSLTIMWSISFFLENEDVAQLVSGPADSAQTFHKHFFAGSSKMFFSLSLPVQYSIKLLDQWINDNISMLSSYWRYMISQIIHIICQDQWCSSLYSHVILNHIEGRFEVLKLGLFTNHLQQIYPLIHTSHTLLVIANLLCESDLKSSIAQCIQMVIP